MASSETTGSRERHAGGFKETISATYYMISKNSRRQYSFTYLMLKSLSVVFNIFSALLFTLIPGLIISELTEEARINVLLIYVAILALSPILFAFINRFIEVKCTKLNTKITIAARREFETKLATIEYSLLENSEFNDLRERIQYLCLNPNLITDQVISLAGSIIRFICMFSIIATLTPLMLILALIVVIVNFFITRQNDLFQHNLRVERTRLDRFLNAFFYSLYDPLDGKDVRLYRVENYFSDIIESKREIEGDIRLKSVKNNQKAQILTSISGAFQQILLYAYLIYKVIRSGMSVGLMSVYLSAIAQLTSSISGIVGGYLELSKHTLSINEVRTFDSYDTFYDNSTGIHPEFNSDSTFEFKNVCFKYPGTDRLVLRDINITLHCNKKICIVGENGAGKSTFIKLLLGLYRPTSGEILFNNVPISEYNQKEYAKIFAPVFQNYALFMLTLKENIVLSDSFDSERFQKACTDAELDDIISSWKLGVDTPVFKCFTDDGIDPSGGESQRIAIARALYHGGDFYILDEPTASVDPNAEYELYEHFNRIIKNKAAILISHRLSAVKLADEIIVFHDGRITESGTHKQLYSLNGEYTKMFDRQSEFYVEANS